MERKAKQNRAEENNTVAPHALVCFHSLMLNIQINEGIALVCKLTGQHVASPHFRSGLRATPKKNTKRDQMISPNRYVLEMNDSSVTPMLT